MHQLVIVVTVKRQVAEADLGELKLRRRESHERFGELAVERSGGEAADELADAVGAHVILLGLD
jgi:hypothetical protein